MLGLSALPLLFLLVIPLSASEACVFLTAVIHVVALYLGRHAFPSRDRRVHKARATSCRKTRILSCHGINTHTTQTAVACVDSV